MASNVWFRSKVKIPHSKGLAADFGNGRQVVTLLTWFLLNDWINRKLKFPLQTTDTEHVLLIFTILILSELD